MKATPQKIYLDNSDPNNIIQARGGAVFYRDNLKFYLITSNKVEEIKVLLKSFAYKQYAKIWYPTTNDNCHYGFLKQYETWVKADNSGDSKQGWIFVNNKKINFTAYVLPTPTPTPSITASPTPTPTNTPTPTPTLSITPTPTPSYLYPDVNVELFSPNSTEITYSVYDKIQWTASYNIVDAYGEPWEIQSVDFRYVQTNDSASITFIDDITRTYTSLFETGSNSSSYIAHIAYYPDENGGIYAKFDTNVTIRNTYSGEIRQRFSQTSSLYYLSDFAYAGRDVMDSYTEGIIE